MYNIFVLDHFHNEPVKTLKILVFLFRECNNHCEFCFQKRYGDRMKTIQFFNDNVKQYCGALDKALSDYRCYGETSVSLMGGELFFERSTTRGLLELVTYLSKYDIKIRFTSNLINSDIHKIDAVLGHCHRVGVDVEFFTSFDFGDLRFSAASMRDSFAHNLYRVNELCRDYDFPVGVEVIRTKKMLESYLNEDTDFEFFKRLTSSMSVCQNELIGNEHLKLTVDESVLLWKLVLDKTPNISDLRSHFFETGRNCFNITRRTVIGSAVINGCGSQKIGIMERDDKETRMFNMLNKYGCYTCRHFGRCSLKCPYEDYYERCDKREVFDYIDEKGLSIQ